MTTPTDDLAQALHTLLGACAFLTIQSDGRGYFESGQNINRFRQAIADGWKALDGKAHESRAQPAAWPVELRAIGFNDAAAVIGYMDDIDAEVARITGDEGEDSSLQVLRQMPDYQPAQPASVPDDWRKTFDELLEDYAGARAEVAAWNVTQSVQPPRGIRLPRSRLAKLRAYVDQIVAAAPQPAKDAGHE